MVVALGGTVEADEDAAEVGTYEIELLEAGTADPLFSGIPTRFDAQLGHKDRAIILPSGITNLARSERCPYQAMRIGDGHVYATQFHPELTGKNNLGRFNRYLDLYSHILGADRVTEMLDGFGPSPHTEGLLKRFATLVRPR